MKMYALIDGGKASKFELETCYTLDEALKLYALLQMHSDIERGQAEEMKQESERARSRR